MSSDNTQTPARVTLNTLTAMKQAGEKFTMLTAYDASFAALLDAAGVDVLLVGDTLGMVIQGNDTTLPVTMDDMVYHTRCVSRAARRALVLADNVDHAAAQDYVAAVRAPDSGFLTHLMGDLSVSVCL